MTANYDKVFELFDQLLRAMASNPRIDLERIPVMFERSPHGERSFCIPAD